MCPEPNHAIRLLVGTLDGQRPIKAFRAYLVSTYAAVFELAQTLRGGAVEAVPCQDIWVCEIEVW